MNGRYYRQLPLIGEEGQEKLSKAKIGIAGCGGLGTTVVTNLSSAGVGDMVIVDPDVPEISNLNRQFVYREGDTNPKAEKLAEWALSVNPHIKVKPVVTAINDENLNDIFGDRDILVDCLDNYGIRRVLNRYAVEHGKTLVHAGVTGLSGQVTVVVPGKTPCVECLYKGVPEFPKGQTMPSLGAMVSTIAAMEAAQVILMVTGIGNPLKGKMATVDIGEAYFDSFDICRDPECPVCSKYHK